MGKVPIRLKEITYVLSPFEQSVMSGLTKDLGHKAAHHVANVSSRQRELGRGRGGAALAAAGSRQFAFLEQPPQHACRVQWRCRQWLAVGGGAHTALLCVSCPPQLRDAVLFAVAPIVGIA